MDKYIKGEELKDIRGKKSLFRSNQGCFSPTDHVTSYRGWLTNNKLGCCGEEV